MYGQMPRWLSKTCCEYLKKSWEKSNGLKKSANWWIVSNEAWKPQFRMVRNIKERKRETLVRVTSIATWNARCDYLSPWPLLKLHTDPLNNHIAQKKVLIKKCLIALWHVFWISLTFYFLKHTYLNFYFESRVDIWVNYRIIL